MIRNQPKFTGPKDKEVGLPYFSKKLYYLRMIDPLQNWGNLRIGLIWAYDGPPTPYARCAYPASPSKAWFIRKGSVILTFGRTRTVYREGCWVFPQARDGWQEFSPGSEILSIRFSAGWPDGQPLFDCSRTITFSENEGGHEMMRIGTRLARFVQKKFPGVKFELRWMSGSPGLYFDLLRLFHGWMHAYADAMERHGLTPIVAGKIDDRVREAVHLMEEQSLNAPLRVGDLAAKLRLSISQINRLFVRDIGKTPAEYWEDRRVATARQALQESRQSIKAVSYDLGFSSLPHFSKWVKKKIGKSPRAVRNSMLKV